MAEAVATNVEAGSSPGAAPAGDERPAAPARLEVVPLLVRVRRVQVGCAVPAGASSPPFTRRFVIGRGPDADFRLDDPTISTQHVALTPRAVGIVIENLSARGSTFLDERPLAPGEAAVVDSGQAWLQVGRALLEVASAPRTIPVHERMAPPTAPLPADLPPLIAIERRGELRLWLDGQPVAVYPAAARVLARLCESPGEVVTHGDLRRAMDPEFAGRAGGANVAQAVTYLRDLFERALEDGTLAPERVRAALRIDGVDHRAGAGAAIDPAGRALLRDLIGSVRGIGYRLHLPASAIRFS